MMSQRQRTRYQRYIVYGVMPLVALFFCGRGRVTTRG
jgi:hypothetical protein